jgi:hypothetical protein
MSMEQTDGDKHTQPTALVPSPELMVSTVQQMAQKLSGPYTHEHYTSDFLRACWVLVARAERTEETQEKQSDDASESSDE